MQNNTQKPKNWQKIIGEFKHNSDRSAAILGTTYLQNYLGRLLASYFVPDTKNTAELLNSSGALSHFDARIRAAYALGLIAPNEFNDLLQIMEIRRIMLNEFEINKFADDSIRQRCFLLKTPREVIVSGETVTPRQLFIFAVALLSGQLLWRSEQAEKERRSAPDNFALIDLEK
ncbi:MAG: hypothetical protein H8E28_10535 [Anaerolineae bacterium]|nr:hypothetical protein [Anaerolineae bacterium]MBL6965197.1 hypothetical protein [Anaerolineales bacterium]